MNNIYDGKNSFLTDFYVRFPHFNYNSFMKKNIHLGLKSEEECCKYIIDNINMKGTKELFCLEEAFITHSDLTSYLPNNSENKYFNIFIGICCNIEKFNLINLQKFHTIKMKEDEFKLYNDELTFILLDTYSLNSIKDINIKYHKKIILYVNTEDFDLNLIKKYDIQFFIINIDSINSTYNILSFINEYKLILYTNNIEKNIYEIYNYKERYEYIHGNKILFPLNKNISVKIFIKSRLDTFNYKINGKEYSNEIEKNIINVIDITVNDVNYIDFEYDSQSIISIIKKYRFINEHIKQLYLSNNLQKYKMDKRIHLYHNLEDYYDENEPSFFYGFAREEDVNTILNHKGKKYIVFSGGDIDIIYHKNRNTPYTKTRWTYLKKLQELDEIYYIPRSSFMIKDMDCLFYKYTYIPFFGDSFKNYEVVPKKEMIYFYTYPDSQKYLYGHDIIEYIKRVKPEFKFLLVTHPAAYKNNIEYCKNNNICSFDDTDEIIKNIQKCFVSIRLTNHDGIANSVLELGLLGINTIYNDSLTPCALNYKSIHDIIKHIENEKNKIGTIDKKLIENVKNHISLNQYIYNTQYYEKNHSKRILFCYGDYPYFGGAATNSYALVKFMKNQANFVLGVNHNSHELTNSQIDPDNIKQVYHIKEFDNYSKIENDIISKLGGTPNYIFIKKWIIGHHLKKIFLDSNFFYILSSVISSEHEWKENIEDNNLYDINLIPQSIRDLTFTDKIIANSMLSKKILMNFNSYANVSVAYTSLMINKSKTFKFLEISNKTSEWESRKYDMCFASSSCDRFVKNINLFKRIASHDNNKNKNKIIIGNNPYFINKNSYNIENPINCEYKNLQEHEELLNILHNVKLVIITSYYESFSNLMIEAIQCGCNILINHNIGGKELINDYCIANNYDEYIEKTDVLCKKSINCLNSNFNYTEEDLYNNLLDN